MNIEPRNNYVLVKVEPPKLPSERVSEGGIVIPITLNEQIAISHMVGTVIHFGPKVDGLKKEDKVLFSKHAGNQIKDIETEICYVLLEESQILAVCK